MTYLKRFWNWLLGKTSVDEKVVETYYKVEDKVETIAEEIKDVKEAVKEVVKQSKDVVEATKGKKRQGRPKKTTKK
jgi:predicted DNA-binding protein YlxM (UPF0122 family)